MRTQMYNVLLICLVLALPLSAAAQVTLTSGDVSAYLAPGNPYNTHVDSATKQLNIGSLGATSWDFSQLQNNYSIGSTTVRADTTAFYGNFPGATNAIKIGSMYSYLKLGSDLQLLGDQGSVPLPVSSYLAPPQIIYQLPMTSGTSWTSSYADTAKVTISGTTYTTVSNVVVTNTVDAYGTLTIPGGGTYQALRLATVRRTTTGSHTTPSVSYQFIAKNGVAVTVVASDTNQPNTGTINVGSCSWNGPLVTTAVSELPLMRVPAQISLEQNYPNPFNPTTRISYELPTLSHVTVKIFNLEGQEIATLVDRIESPGVKSVAWNGANIPSGVYYYRLTAGQFSETKKLMLLK